VKIVSLATLSGGESEVLAESIITEIEMSKRLSRASKHVVRMYDFDFHRQTGLAFLVMELGEQDLEKTLKGQPRLSPAERKNIWRQLVDIAIILHNNHIVIKVLFLYNFLLFFHIGTS
jgi:serine/threonine protein kinase